MTPSEIDLNRIYRDDIAPEADALEQRRLKRVKLFYRIVAVVLGIAVLGGGAVYYFELYNTHLGWVVLAVVIFVLIAYFAIRFPWTTHRNDVKDLVIPAVCKAVGELSYERKPKAASVGAERFSDAGIVGNYNRSKLEDRFVGRHRDTGFQVVEARLRRRRFGGKGSSKSRTVFKGLLFDVEVPKRFSGFLIMVGDKGAFGNTVVSFVRKQFGGLERLDTGHEAFEERYEVYSDSPEEMSDLLAPGFLDTMVALSEATGRSALNGAMIDGRFLLAMPLRQDLFEVGRLLRPLDRLREDLEDVVEEVTIPHRLIDYLHGDRPELMP